ncbi:CbrC family protein [Streptomyces huasconensis]|nr:CbrC family protein [Streptomyces sp. JCM 35825]UFQ19701.1 CbrC family protein [Streptomyces huasconensis]WCL89320.1 CbrC family protein [Streptomyces sp. JCM 35825]
MARPLLTGVSYTNAHGARGVPTTSRKYDLPARSPVALAHLSPLRKDRSGSIRESAEKCACCHRGTGYICTATFYTAQETDGRFCPWCVADGCRRTLRRRVHRLSGPTAP